ncbi:MAG: aspartate aminotransferase family protein [Rhodobacteraceae bacterium]|nr:aspartate aminotransferase family protein [Paracoccaceae bacterium]
MISSIMPTCSRAPMGFEKGAGSWLTDTDGRRFLDFGSGVAVTVLGHAHPRLVAALTAQAGRLWHTSNLYQVPNQQALAEKLVAHTFADTMFFANSGAEAMECAIKCARKYWHAEGRPERHRILTFEGCFHGRTLATISAAGTEKLTKGFGPLLPGFEQLPAADLDAVKAALDGTVAAVVAEPVIGEGGIIPLPDAFLRGLRALCDKTGALLILDEIQSGMGRTGKLFAHEWAGITPDIMAIAKGIGGGFPLGACLATGEAAKGMGPGTHGSTFGGNPLACAVGCAVMDEVTADGFLAHVAAVSGHLRQGLEGLVATYPDVFTLVRGTGLMIGIKCRVANADMVSAGYDAGILTVPGGDNVLRVLPALNISVGEIDEGIARLGTAAQRVAARP